MKLEQSCKGLLRVSQLKKDGASIEVEMAWAMVPEVWGDKMSSGNYHWLWRSRLSGESVHRENGSIHGTRSWRDPSSFFSQTAAPKPLQREILKSQPGRELLEQWVPTVAAMIHKGWEREMWWLLPCFWQEWTDAISYWELTMCHSLRWALNIQKWVR